MADVMAHWERPAEDRAQLLLVTGLGLAMLLVMLALVLNGVIYTENVAARDSDTRGTLDVIRYQHEAVDVTHSILLVENGRSAGDYSTMEANLSGSLGNWSDRSAQFVAREGGVVWVDITDIQHGTRIVQNASREMTNRSGSADWTLVEDSTAIPVFGTTIERSELVNVSAEPANASDLTNQSVFAIEFDSGAEPKTVFIYDHGGQVTIQQADAAGQLGTACSAAGPSATIDFVAGTMDGTACGAIDVLLPLGTATDVSFVDGSNATGTYELVVDRPAIDGDLSDGAGSDPYGERLLYDATISIRYTTPDLEYTNTGVVVRGGDWP